jgi:hypothetical protein
MRGTVERNTMRYYLAIESYMAALGQAPDKQPMSRLQYWFDATEGYSRQLHEVDRNAYLSMKKDGYQRQKTLPAPNWPTSTRLVTVKAILLAAADDCPVLGWGILVPAAVARGHRAVAVRLMEEDGLVKDCLESEEPVLVRAHWQTLNSPKKALKKQS